jgi:F0F1-type ATP synthase membrane subunit b/b'
MSILTIMAVLTIFVGIVYVLMKTGKIEDKDGNNIPDVVDNKVKKVKEVAKETKARVKRVKEEAADVIEAVKEVANQTKDIVDAAKGEKRKGKKPSKK